MYVKLFRSILTSTVWMEPNHILRTWLTLLLLCDSEGYVNISIPGIAKEAHITVDECRDALAKLEAPDPESQHKEEEGRRIIRIGGDVPAWHVVNYLHYRKLRDENQKREYMREYQKEYRRKRKSAKLAEVGISGQGLAQEEEEVEVEEDVKKKRDGRFAPPSVQEVITYTAEKGYHFSPEGFVAFYQSKGWKVGKEPMKDWKAACVTWENRWKAETPGATPLPEVKKLTLCRDCKQPMSLAETMESTRCRACRAESGV